VLLHYENWHALRAIAEKHCLGKRRERRAAENICCVRGTLHCSRFHWFWYEIDMSNSNLHRRLTGSGSHRCVPAVFWVHYSMWQMRIPFYHCSNCSRLSSIAVSCTQNTKPMWPWPLPY